MNDAPPPDSLFKRRPGLALTLFLGGALVILLLLTETALRFTPFGEVLEMQRRVLSIYQSDPVNGFDLKPDVAPTFHVFSGQRNTVFSNDLGCFDDKGRPGPDEAYILLAGDSFTWGYAPYEEKWGTLLEQNLGTRVLKCGVSNYGPKHELRKAKKVIAKIKTPPALIVVAYYVQNDLFNDYVHPGAMVIDGHMIDTVKKIDETTGEKTLATREELEAEYKKKRKPLKVWLKGHSVIYNLISMASRRLKALKRQWKGEKPSELRPGDLYKADFGGKTWQADFWPTHMGNLGRFKALADNHGAKLLVMLIPEKIQVYPSLIAPGPQDYDLDLPNRRVAAYLEKEGIPHLDLLPAFREAAGAVEGKRILDDAKDLYWSRDEHWNVRGNRLAGRVLADYLKNSNLLNRPMQ